MVVGLVGCGNWGRHILRDLVSLGCEVPVVARSPESIARAEKGGGASKVVTDTGSFPALDGVVVATPTSTHAAVLDEVLEREVSVFCEKPLTDDPSAARQLAERAPDRLFVMDKWRYHPGVLELAAIARERRLGGSREYGPCGSGGATVTKMPIPSGFSRRTISRSDSRSSAPSGSRRRPSPSGAREARYT